MVQEYVSSVRVHKYPFEMVMAAYERRFPSCPQIPVVLECVITDDSWSADDSQRHTTRRCQLNVEAPYLLKKMIGVDYVYFIQKNHLDLKDRQLEIEATNETFASRVSVVEKCRYYVHPENADWTCFEQSALLDVKNFFGLESTVEKIAMKQYAANISKGKELIESFMAEVHADGVRELPVWRTSDPRGNRELRRVVSRGTEPLSPRPAADAKKHSVPGPSSRQSALSTITSSRLSRTQSKSTLGRDINPSRHSCLHLADKKPSKILRIHRSKTKLDDTHVRAKEIEHMKDSSSFVDEDSLKDYLEKPKVDETVSELSSKACPCSLMPNTDANVPYIVTRYDNLVVVLTCAVILIYLLSTPLSLLFGTRRDRN
ncbi:protein real-time [Leptidea sinapis]|uniref:protein real-time n=1 Tax=Leptidea sinapis TaxID=189913 RepID=UPI0021280F29|nr:protein real-time [Leptidea sinapis]